MTLKQVPILITVLITVALLAGLTAQAEQVMIWDNFLTNPDGGGYDNVLYSPSEVTTTTPNGAWTADDAIFDQAIELQAIEWAGVYEPGPAGDEYSYTVEIAILTMDGTPETDFQPYVDTIAQDDWEVTDTYGASFLGLVAMNGRVDLMEPIELPAGHYYFAVRLVGELHNGVRRGAHKILTTGNGSISGLTGGAFQSEDYAYNGSPDWQLISDAYPGAQSDFAYRIYGEAIPEPASLLLVFSGLLLIRRR
jgi:hypothetical protein